MYRALFVFCAALLTGCASMTPTVQQESSFVIFDVQSPSINRQQLMDAITSAVQKNQQQVRVTRDIQTGELPDKPGRFAMKDMFANSHMAALLQAQGRTMKMPVCDNPILTLNSGNSSASGNTTFFLCVIPYKAGYSVNIYSTFTTSTGGVSVDALSRALAKSIGGDDSQFIPRAMNDVRTATESVGGKVTIIDSYIPAAFKGIFQDQTASLQK